ncbi:major facilitator superfamily domain-containing protein [Limtongia smithiae]|uniref:major facilitator superfamily domain-containing protein n=1 Tax=Limtongia smithiae TaxID=1125753 RepID=UPI0034CD5307
MPFGILEPHLPPGEHVFGTVHLFDGVSSLDAGAVDTREINLATAKRDGNIILIPQPSDSPNDPLNWSTRKKDFVLFVICLASIMPAVMSPSIASSSVVLLFYFLKGIEPIALLTGYHLVGAACAAVIVTAVSLKYGKRFLYVFACVIVIASSAWAGAATSYRSFLGARILQGVGLAPFETLVNASIGDMYFVHQRGYRLAIANLCLFGSTFLTPVITGVITHNMGWHWIFWLLLIFSCVAGILLFFFVPEHAFNRAKRFNTDYGGEDAILFCANESNEDAGAEKTSALADGEESQQDDTKETYLHSLWLFSRSKTSRPLWKIVLRPFVLLAHPAVIWGCLTQGTMIAWTTPIGVVLAAIFMGPPLWYDEVNTGYMYIGPLIGALGGFVLAGLLSDFAAKYLARRNNNIYEPEFRMVLLIPQLVFGLAGLWGFGITANDMYTYSKYLPPVFFGMEACGLMLGAVASASYITDAHRDLQIEMFVVLILYKNLFSFGLAYSSYNWVITLGTRKVFVIIGSVQVAVSVITMVFYFLGKKSRYFMQRHDILKACRLD